MACSETEKSNECISLSCRTWRHSDGPALICDISCVLLFEPTFQAHYWTLRTCHDRVHGCMHRGESECVWMHAQGGRVCVPREYGRGRGTCHYFASLRVNEVKIANC